MNFIERLGFLGAQVGRMFSSSYEHKYAVLGLGTLGLSLANKLAADGDYVHAVDKDEARVNLLDKQVKVQDIQDLMDETYLDKLVEQKFDAIILCMADSFECQILIFQMLKNCAEKNRKQKPLNIVARASNELQERILKSLGASLVMWPEKSFIDNIGIKLAMRELEDVFCSDDGYVMARVGIKPEMVDKTLPELKLREKHEINVLLVESGKQNVVPKSDMRLKGGDKLLIFGPREKIEKLFKEEKNV